MAQSEGSDTMSDSSGTSWYGSHVSRRGKLGTSVFDGLFCQTSSCHVIYVTCTVSYGSSSLHVGHIHFIQVYFCVLGTDILLKVKFVIQASVATVYVCTFGAFNIYTMRRVRGRL